MSLRKALQPKQDCSRDASVLIADVLAPLPRLNARLDRAHVVIMITCMKGVAMMQLLGSQGIFLAASSNALSHCVEQSSVSESGQN